MSDVREKVKGRWRLVVYPIAIVVLVLVVRHRRQPAPATAPARSQPAVVLPSPQSVWWQPAALTAAGTAYPLEPIEVRALYDHLQSSQRLPGGAAHGPARGVVWVQSVQARHRIEIYPAGTGVYVIGDADFEDFPEAAVQALLDRVESRRETVPLPPESPTAQPQMRPAAGSDSAAME